MVCPAQESVVPEREFVPRDQGAAAGDAAETVDVVDLTACLHHQVTGVESEAATRTFRPIQPAMSMLSYSHA